MFISFWDSVPGDYLVFHQEFEAPYMFHWENGIALHAVHGNRASFPSEGDVSRFLELRQAPGVYSRVTAWMAFGNSTLYSEVRTPV